MSTRKYSTPELKKGKEISSVPKGSSKAIEQAKKTWFVQYMYEGKQIRVKAGLNRIKDYAEKAYEAEVLLNSVKEELKKGFNLDVSEICYTLFRGKLTTCFAGKEIQLML